MGTNNIQPKIFACTNSRVLAEKITKSFGTKLGNIIISKYSDGEFQPSYEESIRGTRIFIIGSTNPSSENLMELLLMVDAAKRASARHITAVIPYFGWARQDRKDKPRVPIAAKMIAGMIESAGATRVMTMDLHADQIQGFFQIPVDHLYASTIFMPYIENLKLDNLFSLPITILLFASSLRFISSNTSINLVLPATFYFLLSGIYNFFGFS